MNVWKLLFFIVLILFIIESATMIYFYKVGTDLINDENECAWDVCADYETYYFDDYTNACYCFIGEELVHEERIK